MVNCDFEVELDGSRFKRLASGNMSFQFNKAKTPYQRRQVTKARKAWRERQQLLKARKDALKAKQLQDYLSLSVGPDIQRTVPSREVTGEEEVNFANAKPGTSGLSKAKRPSNSRVTDVSEDNNFVPETQPSVPQRVSQVPKGNLSLIEHWKETVPETDLDDYDSVDEVDVETQMLPNRETTVTQTLEFIHETQPFAVNDSDDDDVPLPTRLTVQKPKGILKRKRVRFEQSGQSLISSDNVSSSTSTDGDSETEVQSQVFGSSVNDRQTGVQQFLTEDDSSDPESYNGGEDDYQLLAEHVETTRTDLEELDIASEDEELQRQNYTADEQPTDLDPPSSPSSDDDSNSDSDTDDDRRHPDDDDGQGPPGDPDNDPPGDPDDWTDDEDNDDVPFNGREPNDERPIDDAARHQEILLEMLADGLSALRAGTQIGHFAAERIYSFLVEYKGIINLIERLPRCYRTLRRKADKKLPSFHIKMKIRDLETEEEFVVQDEKFERALYGNPLRYKVLETWTTVTLKDAMSSIDRWHNRFTDGDELPRWMDRDQEPVTIDLSWDGVEPDKKKDKVLEVFSMRTADCNRVVALTIYLGEHGCNEPELVLRPFIEEYTDLNVRVRFLLCDSKARVVLMNMIALTGYFGCQWCLARGEPNDVPMLDEHGNRNRRGAAVLWTDKTLDKRPRTHALYVQQGEEAEATNTIVCGVKGTSCVVELFEDVMLGVPIDYFHAVYLGLSRKIMKEILGTSQVFLARPRHRQVKQAINARWPTVHVPSEVQRRPRRIDESSYKASEWKSLCFIGFPIVISSLVGLAMRQEARAFTYFVFLCRAMVVSQPCYDRVRQEVDLKDVMKKFIKSYMKAFGKAACIPSLHLFSHLLEQRSHQPLSLTSTESFESFYAIIKKQFKTGTQSIGKQVLENLFGYYNGQLSHNCRKKYRYRPMEDDIKHDCWIRTENGYKKIVQHLGNGRVTCRVVDTERYTPDVVRTLPFHLIGVARFKRVRNDEVIVQEADIIEKVVKVERVLVSMPFDILYG